ncbi:MAG: tripartite tricarboxylate transporter TctB family protein [Deltaproteobacteria bacterium]|nr:tripartite tricarboxylate transporter TctB family protein [Deltaproteobacteria bacterium]
MDEKTLVKADFITSIFMSLFGLGVVVESWNMPRFAEQNRNPWTAPGLVPGILGALFLLIGIILCVRSIRRGGHHLGLSGLTWGALWRNKTRRRFALAFTLCVFYGLVILGRMPYMLATGLFVFCFIAIFEYDPAKELRTRLRALGTALFQAVLVALIVGFVFQELFLVRLP